jgi:tRNA (5-methylaminomethyl-2-thiouridylate)-methyltransferase
VESLQKGETPNPDVGCNTLIKFGTFHRQCLELARQKGNHHASFASGHYARIVRRDDGRVAVHKAIDQTKDQSYYLSTIPEAVLQRTLFPVGGLLKSDVKKVAQEAGITRVLRNKEESTGICFVGQRRFDTFLAQYLDRRVGHFYDLDQYVQGHHAPLGQHQGHYFYTIGQRAKISGRPKKLFVAQKDARSNALLVVDDPAHPALQTYSVVLTNVCMPHHKLGDRQTYRLAAKVGYNRPVQSCRVNCNTDNVGPIPYVTVDFDEPISAIATGQYLTLYAGDACMGGGKVQSTKTGMQL